jgi:hypothetical protein
MLHYNINISLLWGTRQRGWLKHYAALWEVAGSIPYMVKNLIKWTNPSNSTMTLGSTQPIIEMSARNLPGVKARPEREDDNLTAICGILDISQLYGPPRPVTGISLLLYTHFFIVWPITYSGKQQIAYELTEITIIYNVFMDFISWWNHYQIYNAETYT